jgi:hypothetical protein
MKNWENELYPLLRDVPFKRRVFAFDAITELLNEEKAKTVIEVFDATKERNADKLNKMLIESRELLNN